MSASNDPSQTNYAVLRDCFASPIIARSAPKSSTNGKQRKLKGRKTANIPLSSPNDEPEGTDAEDLADFIDYIACETFNSLPSDLQSLSYTTIKKDPRLADTYTDPIPPATLSKILSQIPPSVIDSIITYSYIPSPSSLPTLLTPILQSYITTVTQPPPPLLTTQRTSACEICQRDWIPLTYHHLIPRSTHVKCLKRGWHEDWRLNSVAWLCRACHSFVHGLAGNEELARYWYSVELLMEREDLRKWGAWVGKVRWKKR